MTTNTDLSNRALQAIGTRTTVTDAELAGNLSNEAIQVNLSLVSVRRRLLRMAPWAFALNTANLVYITSAPGTPENSSATTTLWQSNQPAPPWAYEYQYPANCVRMCWLIPATQTGFAGGIPVTTAVTGGAASFWQGPPVKFVTQNDGFIPVTAAAVASAGTGHAVGDIITGPAPDPTQPPIGAPVQLLVTSVNGSGGITGISVISQIFTTDTQAQAPAAAYGGSYFTAQPNPMPQGTTTGVGIGATFTLTYGPQIQQRVILTNQEFATGVYIQDIPNPNFWDDLFQDAYIKVLGATLALSLSGDKKIANGLIQEANNSIMIARASDANEGLTINDITPDWLRVRGVDFSDPYSGPFTGFDWGGTWASYG